MHTFSHCTLALKLIADLLLGKFGKSLFSVTTYYFYQTQKPTVNLR